MFTVRQSYELINDVMQMKEFPLECRLKILKNIKHDLRKVLKPLDTNPFKETYHYEDEYGEGYYIKEFFTEPFTEEEKEMFIKNQWRYIHSLYDCTGKPFTKSIIICNFKEPNSFGAMSVVYHFLGLDV